MPENRTLLINILILFWESLFLFFPLIAIMTEISDICYFTHWECGVSIRAIPVPGLELILRVKLIQASFKDQIICGCQTELDVNGSI